MTSYPQIVYVIDDDESVRRSLARLLKSAGHAVEVFASAEEFLTGEMSDRSGCLVLDVKLPGLNGMELLQEIADRRCVLPIVFITGHGDIPMSVRAIKAGAVDFLPKPFSDESFLSAVSNALALARRDRERSDEVAATKARIERLTPRERDVLRQVVRGQMNKQIASELGIAEKTVKIHRGQVMRKMQAESVAALVRMAGKVEMELDPFPTDS